MFWLIGLVRKRTSDQNILKLEQMDETLKACGQFYQDFTNNVLKYTEIITDIASDVFTKTNTVTCKRL